MTQGTFRGQTYADGVLHEVHLLELPVPLFARVQEQMDALLREFTMISLGNPDQDDVPQRLLALLAGFAMRFPHMGGPPEAALQQAVAEGVDVLPDLVYASVPEGAEACVLLLRLLDEADAYCASHSEMAVLGADAEQVRFRQWFLSCFVDQIAGRPAVPWPSWT
ncbi:MAG: hypothetical protein JWN31_1888 [Frankiales bacterium]|nr:hypothetical protein [Frankiales bacterium]